MSFYGLSLAYFAFLTIDIAHKVFTLQMKIMLNKIHK